MDKVFLLNFKTSFNSGLVKFREYTYFNKIMTIFWLFGPFLFLIERTPADIWMSSISLIFLLRCFILNDWSSFRQAWIIFALGLWITSVFASLLSPMYHLSLSQSIPWIRFPIYVLAAQCWLGKDRDVRVMFFGFLIISFLILCTILLSEILIEPKVRLTWPYGDPIPGSFLAKSCLSIFCVFSILIFTKDTKKFLISITILFLGVLFLKFTNERSNLILVICGIIVSLVIVNFSAKRFFIISSFVLFLLAISINFFPNLYERCHSFKSNNETRVFGDKQDLINKLFNCSEGSVSFLNQIPLFNFNTSYWGTWRSGLQQGLEKPFLGVGPGGTRHTCGYLGEHWLPGKNYCGNHPHNFYIQLFSETGIFGLILGIFMSFSLIWKTFINRYSIKNCPLCFSSFIIPLGVLFPLQHFGSFFGQWGNLFIWFALGFAMSCSSSNLIVKSSSMNTNSSKKYLIFVTFFLIFFTSIIYSSDIKRWYNYKVYADNCRFEYISFLKNNSMKENFEYNINKFCECKINELKKINANISYRISLINNATSISKATKSFIKEEENINTMCLIDLK